MECKKMPKRGKKYLENSKIVDAQKRHDFQDAVQKAIDTSYAKFDETIDIVVRLGVDPRHADQMVRGTVVLPNGLGKAFGPNSYRQRSARAGIIGGYRYYCA